MIADPHALIEDIRNEVFRRRRELDLLAQERPTSKVRTNDHPTSKVLSRLELQPIESIPKRIRLRDLLKYYDRQFLAVAYQGILKRPMDPGGQWFLDRIRRGKSRIDTLIRLRYDRSLAIAS